MSDHTYWISIGRNVGDRPMPLERWHDFQNACEAVFRGVSATIVTEVGGRGGWEGETEDTHLFLVSLPAHSVNLLRARLALLLPIYTQDAIGFVGGPGESLIFA